MPNNGGDARSGAGLRARWSKLSRGWSEGGSASADTFTEAAIILLVGVLLALYNQLSSEVSSMLRVPALLAGLMLAGQGLNEAQSVMRERRAARAEKPGAGGAPNTQELKLPDQTPVNRGVDAEAGDENGAGTIPWLVIGLSIWLGLATLANPTAPPLLIILSLLAAWLLFSKAWAAVSAEKQPKTPTAA